MVNPVFFCFFFFLCRLLIIHLEKNSRAMRLISNYVLSKQPPPTQCEWVRHEPYLSNQSDGDDGSLLHHTLFTQSNAIACYQCL